MILLPGRNKAFNSGLCGRRIKIKEVRLKNENIYAENIFKAHSMESTITYERRYINSSCNLYYKTDSLVSLSNKALVTKLGIKDLKKLFKNLVDQILYAYII